MKIQEKQVLIPVYPIRLGQFLKFAGIVDDGIEAKKIIKDGNVIVNGTIEIRRGRQLQRGDNVRIGNTIFQCL